MAQAFKALSAVLPATASGGLRGDAQRSPLTGSWPTAPGGRSMG